MFLALYADTSIGSCLALSQTIGWLNAILSTLIDMRSQAGIFFITCDLTLLTGGAKV